MSNRVLIIKCQCGNRLMKILEKDCFVPSGFNCSRCGCAAVADVQKETEVMGVTTKEDGKT